MVHAHKNKTVNWALGALVATLWAAYPLPHVSAQSGTLADPFAPPSPNAALQYQRALLLMSAIDASDEANLKKPLWEVFPTPSGGDAFPGELKRLLYRARHATHAAAKGSRLQICDFGIDFEDAGAATILPHAAPLVRLGHLLTLRGAYAQSQGKWDEAAVIYFDGLRMGRHLTRQRTLLEAMAGMQILENNYYALARWSVECPKRELVIRAFGLLENMADRLIDPARTVASEATILSQEFKQLRAAYPDGPWGTFILDSLRLAPAETEEANRKTAIAECVKRGVPRQVFADTESFHAYLDRLEAISERFAESAAACMKLSGQARIERGQKLNARYAKLYGALGQQELLDAAEVGALFASHEAKLLLLRCAVAVASQKSDAGFPDDLAKVASGFGGRPPVSPYDESPIDFEVSDDGKSFRLAINEARVSGVTLPLIDFSSAAPAPRLSALRRRA